MSVVFVGTPVGVRPAGVVIIVALLILTMTKKNNKTKRDHTAGPNLPSSPNRCHSLYINVCVWTCVFLNRSSFMFVQARADAGPVRGLTVSELAL